MQDAKESVKIIRGRKICTLCLEDDCKADCEHSLGYSYNKTKSAFDDAIEALEKQIPYNCGSIVGTCKCGKALYPHMKYCSACGQALNWGDTE